jgi:hypothetical protein
MIVYTGEATLDDGDRQEAVQVSIHGPYTGSADQNPKWGGRVLSNCDWGYWVDSVVSIALPDGRQALVALARSGVLTGIGPAPFGEPPDAASSP